MALAVPRNSRFTFIVLSTMNDYEFYNHNPEGNRISDCVSRAIGTATGLSYTTTNRLLANTAQQLDCDKLCVCCYEHLLSEVLGFTRYCCEYKLTVRDIAKEFSEDVLIIRVNGHLTCAKYGTVLDTWDCSSRLVDCFWVIK